MPVALAVLAAAAASAIATPALAAPGVERILDGVPVSRSSDYVAQTPLAVHDGNVYIATVEPGPGPDRENAGDLRTVVRKGVQTSPGEWDWRATVVEDRTVADRWHTPPSVGVDEWGHVHVAYNMHNLPWQYAVSASPGDIDSFEFRGQAVSQEELDRYRLENRTGFPDLGSAAIPGTQVTYPAFSNDRSGRLHVTYRFAAKPARRWSERTLSTGLARYDVGSRTWSPLGGPLELASGDHDGRVQPPEAPRAVASATGWTSYAARLTFGPGNEPTVSLQWRDGGPGATTARPCIVTSDAGGRDFRGLDGSTVPSPSGPYDCPPVTSANRDAPVYSIGDAAADAAGRHHVLLSPVRGTRTIHSWTDDGWASEPAPGGAIEILFDADDNLWAIGTGPSVHVKRKGGTGWRQVASGGGGCFPHAELDVDGRTAYVYTLDCDGGSAAVTKLDLRALLDGS